MELIRTELTPRERLQLYSRGEEVDRIPTAVGAHETIPILYGISQREYYFSADRMVEVETRMAEDFDADNMGIGLGLRTLVEALGTKLHYCDDNVSSVETPAIRDYAELDGRGPADIETDGRLPMIMEAFERLMETFGEERVFGTGLAGPVTTAMELVGVEKFLMDSIREPENIQKLLRYTTMCVVRCARDIHQKLGISLSISEPMASREIFSLKQFRKFALPALEETVKGFETFQGAPGLHVCGRSRDRWEDLVNLGISSFSIDNCESIAELKALYGDRVAIPGNIAPVDVLRFGTPADVESAVKQNILDAGDAPLGYRVNAGCTVPVGTPMENMIAYMNAAAIYGRGARKGVMPKGITEEKA
jgi:uroporphyrinogen decarboxylase